MGQKESTNSIQQFQHNNDFLHLPFTATNTLISIPHILFPYNLTNTIPSSVEVVRVPLHASQHADEHCLALVVVVGDEPERVGVDHTHPHLFLEQSLYYLRVLLLLLLHCVLLGQSYLIQLQHFANGRHFELELDFLGVFQKFEEGMVLHFLGDLLIAEHTEHTQ